MLVIAMVTGAVPLPGSVLNARAADITQNTAVVINESNKDKYESMTITGTVPDNSSAGTAGSFISKGAIFIDGIELNLTINGFQADYSSVLSQQISGISLANGAKLHLTVKGSNTLKGGYGGAGIAVPAGCTLEITAESDGTLNATGGNEYGGGAGIGSIGDRDNRTASMSELFPQGLGDIIINGGTINANGGNWTQNYTAMSGAAGIGSSEYSGAKTSEFENSTYLNNITGSITINGGTVTATGGCGSAGIGGGTNGTVKTITISGGNVTATGKDLAAAIGLGVNGFIDESTGTLTCPDVTISGGKIEAKGNIGYGEIVGQSKNTGGSVTIRVDAKVTCSGSVTADRVDWKKEIAALNDDFVLTENVEQSSRIGIIGKCTLTLSEGTTLKVDGGIHVPFGSFLTINGSGTLEARGHSNNAAIGGNDGEDTCGTVIIDDGIVKAEADSDSAAGIGSGKNCLCGGTIIINGGYVTAKGGNNAPGIGGKGVDSVTINGGNVTATGGNNAPDIGGNGVSSVTINGGIVEATAKGIQIDGFSGDITINGGQVTATRIKGPIFKEISLGWKNKTDFIKSNSYGEDVNFKSVFFA